MEKTDLRPLVFGVLRREPETQFADVEHKIRQITPDYKSTDGLELHDIFWELLIQGVLAPGINSSNVKLPFIHVTEYGKKCIQANSILPHDPDGYMKRLEDLVEQPLDNTILTYVKEGLLTFLGGYYLAATVMLGVASEQCIDLLIDVYTNALSNPNKRSDFENKVKQVGRSIKNRFDTIRSELLTLNLPSHLKDALDIQLSGIFTLIRYSRNDAGHPTSRMIDRDIAHGNLLLFPQYCKRVYDLIGYFKTNPM
jgi:hypothetical protein